MHGISSYPFCSAIVLNWHLQNFYIYCTKDVKYITCCPFQCRWCIQLHICCILSFDKWKSFTYETFPFQNTGIIWAVSLALSVRGYCLSPSGTTMLWCNNATLIETTSQHSISCSLFPFSLTITMWILGIFYFIKKKIIIIIILSCILMNQIVFAHYLFIFCGVICCGKSRGVWSLQSTAYCPFHLLCVSDALCSWDKDRIVCAR